MSAAGVDRAIAGLLVDGNGFRWRDAWILSAVGHDALKWAMVGVWALCLLAAPAWRRGALYMLLAAVAVTLLKQASPFSCPWDLAAYGGSAQPPGPGRCLPAGHPVTGFMLFGLYFALAPDEPRAARAALVAAWVIGLLAGAVQVARGAHFASHVLWTACVAWMVTLAADALCRARP
jgi:membrane-associated PAP2 superfamily phosphatase